MNILVLCTGNSCRSILAEVLFNDLGEERVTAFSAGSRPVGEVNPDAVAKLEREGHPVQGLESKSWDRFGGDGAPALDIVITVCDRAAGETCPLWLGSPVQVHWEIPDPADATPDDTGAAFNRAYTQLRECVENTLALPLESMDSRSLADALHRIHDASIGNVRLSV